MKIKKRLKYKSTLPKADYSMDPNALSNMNKQAAEETPAQGGGMGAAGAMGMATQGLNFVSAFTPQDNNDGIGMSHKASKITSGISTGLDTASQMAGSFNPIAGAAIGGVSALFKMIKGAVDHKRENDRSITSRLARKEYDPTQDNVGYSFGNGTAKYGMPLYGNGGETTSKKVEPIYTGDPYDKKLKAFQDSSFLHKQGRQYNKDVYDFKDDNLLYFNPNSFTYKGWTKEEMNKNIKEELKDNIVDEKNFTNGGWNSESIKEQKMFNNIAKKALSTNNMPVGSYSGEGYFPAFQKPVQPVILKPVPRAGNINIRSESLEGFALGGDPQFKNGGGPQPIYTSDKNDPRLKDYTDSLSLFNKTKNDLKDIGNSSRNTPVYVKKGVSANEFVKTDYNFVSHQLLDVSGKYDVNMNPNNSFPTPKVKQKIMPIAGIGVNEGNSMGGWYNIYKKPVQPVIFKPVPRAGNINIRSESLEGFKNGGQPTTQDSLLLYNNQLLKDKFYKNNSNYTNEFEPRTNNSHLKRLEKQAVDKNDGTRQFINNQPNVDFLNKKFKTNVSKKELLKRFGQVSDNVYSSGDILDGNTDAILNTNAPPSYFSSKILPQKWNNYSSENFGDASDVPMYDPIAVKPVSMLTPTERKLREKKYPNSFGQSSEKPVKVPVPKKNFNNLKEKQDILGDNIQYQNEPTSQTTEELKSKPLNDFLKQQRKNPNGGINTYLRKDIKSPWLQQDFELGGDPRSQSNIEAEQGEAMQHSSGKIENIEGQKHENGGTPLQVQPSHEYIYSDSLGYDREGNMTLDENLVRYSFADNAKKIERKYKGRENDSIVQKTKELELGKLKQDAEQARVAKEEIEMGKQMKKYKAKYGADLKKFANSGSPYDNSLYWEGNSGQVNTDGSFSGHPTFGINDPSYKGGSDINKASEYYTNTYLPNKFKDLSDLPQPLQSSVGDFAINHKQDPRLGLMQASGLIDQTERRRLYNSGQHLTPEIDKLWNTSGKNLTTQYYNEGPENFLLAYNDILKNEVYPNTKIQDKNGKWIIDPNKVKNWQARRDDNTSFIMNTYNPASGYQPNITTRSADTSKGILQNQATVYSGGPKPFQPGYFDQVMRNSGINLNNPNVIPGGKSFAGRATASADQRSTAPEVADKVKNGMFDSLTTGDKMQLASMLPAFGFNMGMGLRKADVEPNRKNQYENDVLSMMANRKFDIQNYLNQSNLATNTAKEDIGNNSTSVGGKMANLQKLFANQSNALGDITTKGQEMNNQYRAEEANTKNIIGEANRAESIRAAGINDQNKARKQQFLAKAFEQMGQGIATTGQSANQSLTNKLLIKSLSEISPDFDVKNMKDLQVGDDGYIVFKGVKTEFKMSDEGKIVMAGGTPNTANAAKSQYAPKSFSIGNFTNTNKSKRK